MYEVAAGSAAHSARLHPDDALYGGTIRLVGDDLAKEALPAGTVLSLPLVWRLEQPTHADLRRFVHVIGPAKADGSTIYAQHDSAPCDNSVPTWQWRTGEIMLETVKVDLPPDLATGSYRVYAGWYDSANLQRLPATDTAGQALGDTIELTTIQVTGK